MSNRSRRLLQLWVRKPPQHPLGCWPKSTEYYACIPGSLACTKKTLVELNQDLGGSPWKHRPQPYTEPKSLSWALHHIPPWLLQLHIQKWNHIDMPGSLNLHLSNLRLFCCSYLGFDWSCETGGPALRCASRYVTCSALGRRGVWIPALLILPCLTKVTRDKGTEEAACRLQRACFLPKRGSKSKANPWVTYSFVTQWNGPLPSLLFATCYTSTDGRNSCEVPKARQHAMTAAQPGTTPPGRLHTLPPGLGFP